MLQNARVTAFTVSALKENQQERNTLPPQSPKTPTSFMYQIVIPAVFPFNEMLTVVNYSFRAIPPSLYEKIL